MGIRFLIETKVDGRWQDACLSTYECHADARYRVERLQEEDASRVYRIIDIEG